MLKANLAFLVLFLLLHFLPERMRRAHHAVLLAMPPVALAINVLSSHVGASQVLLVIWVACTFTVWPRWPQAPA